MNTAPPEDRCAGARVRVSSCRDSLSFTHEVRFVAFHRYPFTSAIGRFIKRLYARNLHENFQQYVADDELRQHMTPGCEMEFRRIIPSNRYLPALSRENLDVDIGGNALNR